MPLVVVEQAEHLELHEHLDAVGHCLLLQGPDHLEAGAVAHVGQPGEAVAPEVTLEDEPIGGAVEERPPLFELADTVGRLLGMELGHAPVVEHLPAPHGVPEVHLPVVVGVDVAESGRDPSLGHDRVGLAEERLAHEGGAQAAGLGLDGRPYPGTPGADDDDVEVVGLVVGHVHVRP